VTGTELGRIRPTAEDFRSWLIGRVADYLELPAAQIDPDAPIVAYGLDSVYAFTLCGEITETWGLPAEPDLFWQADTLGDLAGIVLAGVAGAAE
jgi:acyl carrier protein